MSSKRLKTMQQVRFYVASLIRRVEASIEGKPLDAVTACKLGYLANILKSCVESADIEQRLAAIEQQLAEEGRQRQ